MTPLFPLLLTLDFWPNMSFRLVWILNPFSKQFLVLFALILFTTYGEVIYIWIIEKKVHKYFKRQINYRNLSKGHQKGDAIGLRSESKQWVEWQTNICTEIIDSLSEQMMSWAILHALNKQYFLYSRRSGAFNWREKIWIAFVIGMSSPGQRCIVRNKCNI